MVIEDKLRENAALYPDKVALVCGEKSLTYYPLSPDTVADKG